MKQWRNYVIITTISHVLKRVKKSTLFLHYSPRLYRFLRLVCCWIEDAVPGVSEEAGFKVAIAWTEDLGFDREDT